jgi:hypothetical protein
VKINSEATDGMEHFQMARQETRIVDIGLPNKRGNTITRQKLRPACRRFAWVNSRLWSDYAQHGSYRFVRWIRTEKRARVSVSGR